MAALEGLYPLKQTIKRLGKSPRISIESPSREILEHARDGVEAAIQLFSEDAGSEVTKVLEEEIREAASGLEDALDSHVSDQLSESIHPLLINPLDLEGVKQHIDGFTQHMKYLKKLFLPRDQADEDENESGYSSDQSRGHRTWTIDWLAASIESPSREILEHTRDDVEAAIEVENFLDDFSQDAGSEVMEVLEEEIREAANGLEDALDSHVSDQLSETESIQLPLITSVDLEGVKQHIDGFTQKTDGEDEDEPFMAGFSSDESRAWIIDLLASKAASMFLGMKAHYIQELGSLFPKDGYPNRSLIESWWANKAASAFMMDKLEYVKEEEDDDYAVPSTSEFAENMVGLTDQFCEIRDNLLKDPDESPFTTIWGMAGLGKTALANKILQDPLISSSFESRIFLRIGREYKVQNILRGILAQLDPDNDKIHMEEDECLHGYLRSILQVRKTLIVFDDVWDLLFWNELHMDLQYDRNDSGCRFLMTTRLKDVAGYDSTLYIMRFLNKKESWDLLQGKVFVGEACPRELEKAGKQIAENCEGLPLLVITVADLLSKSEKTLEYWSMIASSKKNSIFIDAYEEILKVLYPSYYNLPQHLKTCFFYLGAFPQNSEVRISKLINLWGAEELRRESYENSRESVMCDFDDLVSNSVTLETQRSSFFDNLKACTLHSVFWYLCKREAWNENFLHVLDSHLDASVEDIGSRRRLSVYKNSIFSIKDVHDSLASISGIRSLLCTGPYHPYQVPMCFYLRLLKVLDALTIRFYEFPLEVVKLVHLRYLAFTCNENLPPSISNLWNLQCLIVHRHQSIKASISESYLPVEIWDLLELEYLQIMGRNLPDPPPGAVLEKLLILLDVGAHTCTKRVLESIPNLEKLRVQIELTPDATEPLSFFDEISHVKELGSLQCVIVNPEMMFVAVAPASLASAFFLRKLTLSGFGYPWKDIIIIAELPCLQVLKLRCYAFKGEEWEVGETKFQRLKYFSIEDTDLKEWTGGSENFPELEYLTIKHCYKLKEIPQMPCVREIRVVDCNPSAVTWAKQMAPNNCRFYVDSSWLDKGN